MSVTEVLLNFRQALLAILPAIERVGIPWRRPDAYDEWDSIASALFESLVFQVLHFSLPDSFKEKFRIPDYDLFLPTYTGLSVLEVRHPALPCGRYLFHSFGTENCPFDVVELRRISDTGEPYDQNLTLCSVEGATFRLLLAPWPNDGETIEEVNILE